MEIIHAVTHRIRGYLLMLAPVFAGCISGLSCWYPHLAWCAVVGFALCLMCIHTAKHLRYAVLSAVVVGWVKMAMSVSWLLDVYPADWLGAASRSHQLALVLFCYVGTFVSVGLGYALVALIARASFRAPKLVYVVCVGSGLLVAELAGALFFSLYTVGEFSPLNTYFGYGMSGYALADHALLRLAAWYGGSFALTAVVGFSAALLFVCVLSPNRQWRYIGIVWAVCIVLTTFIPFTVPYRHPQDTRVVAALRTVYPPRAYTESRDAALGKIELEEAVARALSAHATLVLLPEAAQLAGYEGTEKTMKKLQAMPHDRGSVVVDSYDTRDASGATYMRGYIYDLDTGTVYTTDKHYLVPVGEYLPYLHKEAIEALGGAAFFADMNLRQGAREIEARVPERVPSVLFCFESGASAIAARKKDRALIVHPVSHAWFHTPTSLWNQERQMLIVQSLYTGRPILQAGNNAPSVLYMPDGTLEEGEQIFSNSHTSVYLFRI